MLSSVRSFKQQQQQEQQSEHKLEHELLTSALFELILQHIYTGKLPTHGSVKYAGARDTLWTSPRTDISPSVPYTLSLAGLADYFLLDDLSRHTAGLLERLAVNSVKIAFWLLNIPPERLKLAVYTFLMKDKQRWQEVVAGDYLFDLEPEALRTLLSQTHVVFGQWHLALERCAALAF